MCGSAHVYALAYTVFQALADVYVREARAHACMRVHVRVLVRV